MNFEQNFREIEKRIGVGYPLSLYEYIEDFEAVARHPKFRENFGEARLMTSMEIQSAMTDVVPDGLLPFFVDQRGEFNDYYCFDMEGAVLGERVVVFASDAIVFEWKTFQEFLSWLAENQVL